jgi:hypothetical protein
MLAASRYAARSGPDICPPTIGFRSAVPGLSFASNFAFIICQQPRVQIFCFAAGAVTAAGHLTAVDSPCCLAAAEGQRFVVVAAALLRSRRSFRCRWDRWGVMPGPRQEQARTKHNKPTLAITNDQRPMCPGVAAGPDAGELVWYSTAGRDQPGHSERRGLKPSGMLFGPNRDALHRRSARRSDAFW